MVGLMPDEYDDLLGEYSPNEMPVFIPVLKIGDYVHAFKYDVYGIVVRINWQGVLVQTDEDPPRFGGFGARELRKAARTCWDRLTETAQSPFRYMAPVIYRCSNCSFSRVWDPPPEHPKWFRMTCCHRFPTKDIDPNGHCEKWSQALVGVPQDYA